MTHRLRILAAVAAIAVTALGLHAERFSDNFSDSTLRVDYILSGNADHQAISLDGMSRLPGWYGKRHNLSDIPTHGAATVTMRRASDGEVIFRHTFSTLFQEWLDLDDAKGAPKAFEVVQLLPMPLDSVVIETALYDKRHNVTASITHGLSPRDRTLRHLGEENVPHYITLNEPADPARAINIAFLAEGYTEQEKDSFLDDCRKAVDGLFSYEPFKSNRQRFRVVAVPAVSRHSGPSMPFDGVWHETAVGSSFDTFGMARYLTTLRIKQMHDALAGVPYDHVMVFVNTDRYGGGGIYNTLNLLMTKHRLFIEVLVHEFGHSFAGLADEYAYENEQVTNYPLDIEPWEQNVTTLVDFDSKWKALTPKHDATVYTASDDDLDTEHVALYNGAGGVVNGVYRPCPNCMMRTLKVPRFCPVCVKAIQQTIDHYFE